VDRGRIVAQGTPDGLKNQLGGDAIVIDLADPRDLDAARATVTSLAEVGEVVADGGTLRVRVPNGPAATPRVLTALDARSVAVDAIRVTRPSLDDVYLRYAGRSFEKADREGEKS
jgi:ABC-2 type transport system ATP-binding protein